MSSNLTPRLILETLLPHLKLAAVYARTLQPKIASLPAKEGEDNFFATALTDADVAIQNLVELALLANFPEIRFYGEEYANSLHTKYFRATNLGAKNDYLVTLDPIDGTRFYLDGHFNYQIIFSVLNIDDFEGVLALSPGEDSYFYALRGEGAFQGKLEDDLAACRPFRIGVTKPQILLGWGMGNLAALLANKYQVVDIATAYAAERQIPNFNSILQGEIRGAIIEAGKFIDGGALAFLAREAGCLVTTWDGSSPPPLNQCQDYSLPGLVVSTTESVHQDLLEALRKLTE